MKKLLTLILALSLMLALAVPVFAASTEAEDAATALYNLGLFKGTGKKADGSPNFELDRNSTRNEAVTMLVRLLGKEREALTNDWPTPFSDVVAWVKPYVGYAYVKGLTNGTSPSRYSGDQTVTAAQYLTFVLRALGYTSGSDFQWDKAWELTDRLGITHGQFGETTNRAFLRSDMAMVSYNALSAKIKGSDKTLLETILSADAPSPSPSSALRFDDYMARKLNDTEIRALKDADLEVVRKEITTLGDAIAWMDNHRFHMYNTFSGGLGYGWAPLYEEAYGNQVYGTEVYAALCGYLICDDYKGVKLLLGNLDWDGTPQILSGLCLPVQQGHYLCGPSDYSINNDGNNSFAACLIEDLEQLEGNMLDGMYGREGYPIENLFLADAGQALLRFAVDSDGNMAVTEGQARCLYSMDPQEKQDLKNRKRLDHAQDSINGVKRHWNSYGLPVEMAPTMTFEQAGALYGKSLTEVADAVKTFGDCIYYLAAAGFGPDSGDIQTHDSNSLWWHYNYAPAAVLARNRGNCGASAALAAALLEGDYDEVGMLGMTFRQGEGGGHIITYITSNGKSYVFDMVNLVGRNFSNDGMKFSSGSTLREAAEAWAEKYEPWSQVHVLLMCAYTSFNGDAPVGWDDSHISYLPESFRGNAQILWETPAEGYIYQFKTIDPDVQREIDQRRNFK